jgi:hypothetical protein
VNVGDHLKDLGVGGRMRYVGRAFTELMWLRVRVSAVLLCQHLGSKIRGIAGPAQKLLVSQERFYST